MAKKYEYFMIISKEQITTKANQISLINVNKT